jgi:hypothetical protein
MKNLSYVIYQIIHSSYVDTCTKWRYFMSKIYITGPDFALTEIFKQPTEPYLYFVRKKIT